MSPSERMALLYPEAPDYLFIVFYDSQGFGEDILTRLDTGLYLD
jgi:hypothetical protein